MRVREAALSPARAAGTRGRWLFISTTGRPSLSSQHVQQPRELSKLNLLSRLNTTPVATRAAAKGAVVGLRDL